MIIMFIHPGVLVPWEVWLPFPKTPGFPGSLAGAISHLPI